MVNATSRRNIHGLALLWLTQNCSRDKEGGGLIVNRKHVQRIMRQLGLASNQPGPNTSKPHPEHVKFPYLLRGMILLAPLEVWSTDITYIRLPQGYGGPQKLDR